MWLFFFFFFAFLAKSPTRYLFSSSVLHRRHLTCRGQCLFYSTGSDSGHNWAYMVQVTPAEMATYFPFFNEALQ